MRKRNFATVMPTRPRESLGGARPIVQMTAEAAENFRGPQLAARMYAAPSILLYDSSDPRFAGKANNVENIYQPAPLDPVAPRSGFRQMLNWLTTGKME